VQAALEAMRSKEDGSPVRPATVNTYVAAVKSFLGFAHRVGFTRFNAGPLIKLKKAPRQIAQRILSEVQVALLIRAAKTDRDRLMFDLAYLVGGANVIVDCLPRLLGQLEANRVTGLPLPHGSTVGGVAMRSDVLHLQSDDITTTHVRGSNLAVLEREWLMRMAVIEFPSRAAAESWYKSADYQRLGRAKAEELGGECNHGGRVCALVVAYLLAQERPLTALPFSAM
jgi:hypothetical protein